MGVKFICYMFYLYLFFFILILAGVLMGKLSFGLGLGDIGIIVVNIVVVILGGLGVYYRLKLGSWNILIALFFMAILIYLLLSLTFLRGVENPWDGNIFIK
jgi:hypothetical protein